MYKLLNEEITGLEQSASILCFVTSTMMILCIGIFYYTLSIFEFLLLLILYVFFFVAYGQIQQNVFKRVYEKNKK